MAKVNPTQQASISLSTSALRSLATRRRVVAGGLSSRESAVALPAKGSGCPSGRAPGIHSVITIGPTVTV